MQHPVSSFSTALCHGRWLAIERMYFVLWCRQHQQLRCHNYCTLFPAHCQMCGTLSSFFSLASLTLDIWSFTWLRSISSPWAAVDRSMVWTTSDTLLLYSFGPIPHTRLKGELWHMDSLVPLLKCRLPSSPWLPLFTSCSCAFYNFWYSWLCDDLQLAHIMHLQWDCKPLHPL